MARDDLDIVTAAGELERIGRAEIVVGIPGPPGGRTVRATVAAASAGLARAYPGASCAVVVADPGRREGTPEPAGPPVEGGAPVLVVRPHAGPPPALAAPRGGLPLERESVRSVLLAVERLGARACALVDGDVRGFAADWVRRLVEPVLHDGLDLVAPLYDRHRYDGLLTAGLVYPLTRALYGLRVRQPVAGHLALSAGLVGRLLRSGVWDRGAGPGALDVWMTTTALAEGLRVGQAHLGTWRRGTPGADADLGATFSRVVSTMFGLMEDYRPAWWAVVGAAEVPSYGPPPGVGLDPVSVNVDRMISTFRQGALELASVWRRALTPETAGAVAALGEDGAPPFTFPPELWARAVYDCAAAYHRRALPRSHLLRAIIPLYLGRAAAFVLRTERSDAAGVEAEIEALCGAFEAMKPHLLDRWDAPRP